MSAVAELGRRFFDWFFRTEASSRSSALMRMSMAAIVWATLAHHHFLYGDLSLAGIARSTGFFVASAMMFFGLFSRLSSLVTGGICLYLVYWVGHHEGAAAYVHHNTTLLATGTFLIALTPCDKSYSIDRWLALRRAEREGKPPPLERGNVWGLRLIAFQLSAIYFFGAWDKTGLVWMSGARMDHFAMWFYFGSRYPPFAGFSTLMMLLAWSTMVFEYMLTFGLFFRLGRKYLILPGMVMHGLFHWLLNVSAFTTCMWTMYLAFFDPDEVHAFIDKMSGHAPREHHQESGQPVPEGKAASEGRSDADSNQGSR